MGGDQSFNRILQELPTPLVRPSLAGLDTEGIVEMFLQGMRRCRGMVGAHVVLVFLAFVLMGAWWHCIQDSEIGFNN